MPSPGQRGFVGGTMGETSVVLEGVDTTESKLSLRSTVHGAGRVLATGVYDRKTGACNIDPASGEKKSLGSPPGSAKLGDTVTASSRANR